MDNQLIERIVAEIERRMKKSVLLALTPAPGYQDEICQRINTFSHIRFSLFVTTQAQVSHDLSKWRHLGDMYNASEFDYQQLSTYHALFVPYFDKKLVGEIINGLFISEEGKLIHSALAQNIPVMALPYFCQPESELNEILGLNKNKEYNLLIQENISRLKSMGIIFQPINDIEANLINYDVSYKTKPEYKPEIKQKDNNRYITLNEVMNKPGEYHLSQDKLTDSAIEYLKSLKN
ncbi:MULTISPECIES: hypothetical protein [Enterobacterales]|uniref:hypothetical protein n=2 Tax=Gammaproteobacteria TaxID=1236 RepID=UPI00084832E4|nr:MULTISPECIES: hypothetical protein [Enterobacterales]WOO49408.1 hypothetical protein R2S03_18385 [Hafnia alvei]MCK9781292.1 hypothetical protein [Proteus columbae]ODQ08128.1 hypothetical protein BGK50_12460 [Shigella sp. FC130]OEI93223.1 hypothetical protein BHE86_05345 [Shigella sp. FC1655]WPF03874.1 hypothetical protein SB028_17210 [Proteus vulgaris]